MKVTREVMAAEDAKISEWKGTKQIRRNGSSLTVAVTEACQILGVGRNDVVEVIIRRKT